MIDRRARLPMRPALSLLRCACGVAAVLVAGASIAAEKLQAPNVVAISPRLVTSGQPTRASLASLAAQGFQAVIYLAPPTVHDAVRDEADIVRSQGLDYVNIPIPFNDPSHADFRAFVDAMNRYRDRNVLVHCQVNMRASTMTFLYRVIVGGENPDKAYDAIAAVWKPEGPWRRLIVAELRTAGIAFDPY